MFTLHFLTVHVSKAYHGTLVLVPSVPKANRKQFKETLKNVGENFEKKFLLLDQTDFDTLVNLETGA